ncbi:hypothetical protein QM716_13365 [Rhodococcus sp. IEGM 1409]|uniref:nuclear transport factor 2 family protein n=1 Tax=Rhodococcus sp. IEGM 1409 TaxID=3047082 RepID=UPI0024B7E3B9|nr:hypothetical protein [Rhodococcus sp. IEGM 1409]MDI9900840.1 hypothetical protein [Rhodococcus sp. IEGM 1409]
MKRWFAAGLGTAIVSRSLLRKALLFKFRRDVRALNCGNYRPLLGSYHRDAVLRFADGDHRWAGVHDGRDHIAKFLQEFVAAGLQGEVTEAYFGGPLWRMTLLARFNDRALGPNGSVIYQNRTVLLVRTKWGKIIEQEDYYEDTARIGDFDKRLREIEAGRTCGTVME